MDVVQASGSSGAAIGRRRNHQGKNGRRAGTGDSITGWTECTPGEGRELARSAGSAVEPCDPVNAEGPERRIGMCCGIASWPIAGARTPPGAALAASGANAKNSNAAIGKDTPSGTFTRARSRALLGGSFSDR